MAAPRSAGSRRWETLVRQAREPVYLLGGGSQLVFANTAWERLTGYRVDDLAGRICRLVDPAGTSDPLEWLLSALALPAEAAAGRACRARVQVPVAQGEAHWHECEYLPLSDDEGQPSLCLCVLRSDLNRLDTAAGPLERGRSFEWRVALLEARERLRSRFESERLVGTGAAHERTLRQVEAAISARTPVAVVGPAGSGRTSIAMAIARGWTAGDPARPVVSLDARALPSEVVSRELFGVGAESFARPLGPGMGSCLVIEDVEKLAKELQARMPELAKRGVRIIATSPRSLEAGRAEGTLAAELYFALSTQVITIDALRERLEDLPLTVQDFVERANRRWERSVAGLTPAALDVLMGHDWPGNLRELERIVDAAHARCESNLIDVKDLPLEVKGSVAGSYLPPPEPPPEPLDTRLQKAETEWIEEAMRKARGNKSQAARLLGISRPRLLRRLAELGLILPEEDEGDRDE